MFGRIITCLALALVVAHAHSQDADPAPAGQAFEKVHALVRPDPGELKVKEVPFVPTLWEARRKAAAEGKPILLIGSQGNGLAISRG
jgi:hypothetical protein